ncbi:MAG TPA: ABC transporter permease [Planctomicrobium sp.]|nr:ABC transporter permease [Planctomicrobium sp.]
MKSLTLVFQNIFRNKLRTTLTSLGTMMLVLVVTLVWSVLAFLDTVTSEKTANVKGIVSERWQLSSQMPFAYATSLHEGAARNPGDVRPDDAMSWSFFVGTLDPKSRASSQKLFAFALEPEKLLTMMDELDSLPSARRAEFEPVVKKLTENRQGIIVGQSRLQKTNKRVGERIKLFGLSHQEINLEFEIIGTFPPGQYDESCAIDIAYLNTALDAYPLTHNGEKHPQANKSLNFVWIKVPDQDAFSRVTDQILNSPTYSNPAVKVETAASGIASYLEAYRDLFWGMRYLLTPAILLTLSLVIANAISVSVRERHTEFAIMKVLGFRPGHILALVLLEAVLVGAFSGLVSAAASYYVVNNVYEGLKFPISFFGTFLIPEAAFWWGVAVGGGTALIGSIVPAWSACSIRVSEAFSRVT